MTEEVLQQNQGDQPNGENTSEQQAKTEAAPDKAEQPKFTQSQLDAIIKDRLDREKAQREKAATEAAAKAKEEQLKQNQEWQALAEQRQTELDALNKEVAKIKRENLQREIAEQTGLPSALASRLKGETKEELEEDAKTLLETLPKKEAKPKSPGFHPTNPGGQDGEPPKTAQQIRESIMQGKDIFGGGEVKSISQ